MARPRKKGLDYFPLDVGFLRDRKIKLLRAEFGASSVVFVLYVFCRAFEEEGYFCTWDDDELLIAAEELKEKPSYLSEVLSGCLKRSVFDNGVFQMFGVLTSAGIQRRYLSGCEKRDTIPIFEEYCLLEKNEIPDSVLRKCTFFSVSGEKTPVNSPETPVYSPENPQSKVKESKVKESKEDHPRAREEDDDLKRVCKAYEDSIGLMPRHVAAAAMSFIQTGIETDLVVRAIQLAAENNVRTWNYAAAILRNCENKGIKTLGMFEADRRNRKDEHNTFVCAGGSNESLSFGVHF